MRAGAPLLDRLLGITALRKRYVELGVPGATMAEAVERTLRGQGIQIDGMERLAERVPATGPVVVVCNHPLGGLEGLAVAQALWHIRPDVKVVGNQGLRLIPELRELFIFTNPLALGAASNPTSIRQCRRHLRDGGALVVFPAGAVSTYQPTESGKPEPRISDAAWHRSAAYLALRSGATMVGIFIDGRASPLFHRLGRIHYRLRLLMLPREVLRARDTTMKLVPTRPLDAATVRAIGDPRELTDLCRALVYAGEDWRPARHEAERTLAPLAGRAHVDRTRAEIAALPTDQRLAEWGRFAVFYARQAQCPEVVQEIARLRELTFREHDEGSGEGEDSDRFDATYLHLFAFDESTGEIIGAYRLGAFVDAPGLGSPGLGDTDRLQSSGGSGALYLDRMFAFGEGFVSRRQPCLELGRSFIVPEYQRSPQALLLLWKGIGAFLARFPRYRYLYGTVSLSTKYAPSTISVIQRVLCQPDAMVRPRTPFVADVHPELLRYLEGRTIGVPELGRLVRLLEPDGKGLPVLVKQYAGLGARFYCVGVDRAFRDTPGMLLSVHVPSAPVGRLRRYLGAELDAYLAYEAPASKASGEVKAC